MSLKLAFFWCLCTPILLLSIAGAQTNGIPPMNLTPAQIAQIENDVTSIPAPTPPDAITVTNFQQAIGAAIHYKVPSIDFTSAVKLAGALMGLIVGGSMWLRNIIPDSWQVNRAGVWLAKAAGQINPSVAKQFANAVEEKHQKENPEAANSPVIPPPLSVIPQPPIPVASTQIKP